MSKPPTLTRVHRLDAIRLDSTYFTDEGYLIDTPIVTSVGIFEYKNPNGSPRRELRLPEHVFDEKSLATYEGKPVIITHNAGRVNKNNVADEIVGTILSRGYKDGDDVRAKIIVHDVNEVKRYRFRELSLGYDLVLDETPGEWNGQPYDAIQTEIAINHLALVGEARAGEQARLNIDGTTNILKGARSMAKPNGKKAMDSEELKKTIAAFNTRRQRRLDEAETEEENRDSDTPLESGEDNPAPPPADVSPEEKVQLIKDRRDRRDQEGDPDTPESAMGVIAQQDEDISDLLDIIEAMTAAADMGEGPAADSDTDPQDDCEPGAIGGGGEGPSIIIKTDSRSVDAIVRERLKLGRIGDRLNLDGLEEMNPLDAKKAIIRKVNPSMRLDGKGLAYINAAFDVAADQINSARSTDYQRRQMTGRADGKSAVASGKTSAEKARERMIDKLTNGGNE